MPPDIARKSTFKDKDTGEILQQLRWNESGRILSVEVAETTSSSGAEHTLYTVEFVITPTKGSGTLVGSKTYWKARYNAAAWAAGNKEDGQYKMSRGTLIKLCQLVRAAGFPIQGGLSSAQIAAYFPAGGGSPLINRELNIQIQQKESFQAPSGWNEEVGNVFPLSIAAAVAEV